VPFDTRRRKRVKQISIKNQVATNNRYQKKNRKQREKDGFDYCSEI